MSIVFILLGTFFVLIIGVMTELVLLDNAIALIKNLRFDKQKEILIPDKESVNLEAIKFTELCKKLFSSEDEVSDAELIAFEQFLTENEAFMKYKFEKNESFFLPKELYTQCVTTFCNYLAEKGIIFEQTTTGTIIKSA